MAGGVAQAVSSNWDWEREMRAAKDQAFIQLGRELELTGFLTVEPLPQDSDYRKLKLTLTVVKTDS